MFHSTTIIKKMEYEDLKVEVPLDDTKNSSSLLDVPVKKYENADGNFMVGFDVTSQEAEEKRLKRAKRFGTQQQEVKPKREFEALPSCVAGLPKTDQDAEVRDDAILLFGVNEMSTKDVFDYYKEHMASSIEWIDDMSCVVVWDDSNSARRALKNMSIEFTPASDNIKSDDNTDIQQDISNIWRIGIKHPKSKQLLMRMATTADKKTKGAGNRSLYYLTHGYPNQNRLGKQRGLISTSRKRKIMAERNRIDEERRASPEVEILDADVTETMEMKDDVMDVDDVDEPLIKVLISEDHPRTEPLPPGNLYSDNKDSQSIMSRLSSRKLGNNLRSAKYTEIRKKENPVNDLRQKLKTKKANKWNPKIDLSIEVTDD